MLWAIVAIVIFAAIRGVFAFLQTFWAEKNSQAVAYDLRNDLYAKIQGLSFSYHDKNQTGQLMIRATDDVEKVRLFIGQGLLQLVGAIILLVGTIIILFTTNVSWPGPPCRSCPIALVLFMIFSSAAQPMFRKVQIKLSTLNTILQENLAGIKVIKAFTREKQQQAKFRAAADDLMGQAISVAKLFTFLFPVIFLIANLGQAAILYVGGRQIITGTLTLGRMAGVLAVSDLPLLPDCPARLHHHPVRAGRRLRRPHLRDPGCQVRHRRQAGCDRTARPSRAMSSSRM